MTCPNPNPLDCTPVVPVTCDPEPVEECPQFPIMVCCIEYASVDEAWKATGIPPHKLRHYAKTTAFENIYYV